MNHPDILNEHGTDAVAIRALFTAKSIDELNTDGETVFNRWYKKNGSEGDREGLKKKFAEKLWKKREYWQNRIAADIQEGRATGLKNYKFYMAADMAIQAQPIIPDNFPKLLYASGLIDLKTCCAQLDELGADKKEKFVVQDTEIDGEIKALNLARLSEFSMNLVKSYIRRRKAAQINKYNSFVPYYKYEARSGQLTEKLRADVLSQRIEEMSDQFGYKHQFGQEVEKMLLYSFSMNIADSKWEKDITWAKNADGETEAVIEREGVPFTSPHPTRLFWDTRYPVNSINTDSGITFFGFWNVIQYKDIKNNKGYFNLDAIPETNTFSRVFDQYSTYFTYYFDADIVSNTNSPENSYTEGNQLDSNTAYYNENYSDRPLWETEFYVKLVPADEMMGDYPFPVWLKLSVAGDYTVIFGEFRPTTPAYVMSYDRMDDKVISSGMAHEIMPYEDQANNLASQMLHLMKLQSILLAGIDKDLIPKEARETLMKQLKGKLYMNQPISFEFSGEKTKQLYASPNISAQKRPLHFFQADVGNAINELLKGIGTILGYLDRALMMSRTEMGQLAERETSASEVQLVSDSTEALYEYVSMGIDEGRQAKKKILYESLMAYGSKDLKVTVPERYDSRIVKLAGFEPVEPTIISDDPDDPIAIANRGFVLQEESLTLTGRIDNLEGMEFVYSARDGSNRVSNIQGAKVIADFINRILSSPEIFQQFTEKYGEDKLGMMITELWRQAGVPFALNMPKAPPLIQDQRGLDDRIGAVEEAVGSLLRLAKQQTNISNGTETGSQPAGPAQQPNPGNVQVGQ